MTRFMAMIFVVIFIGISQAVKVSQIKKLQNNQDSATFPRQKRSSLMNPLMVYRCSLPLGLENGHVSDAAITASSSNDAKSVPARSRLNTNADSKGSGAWLAKNNDGKQWLQINFGELVRVTRVATQGRQDADQWVTRYTLSYSMDGMHWVEYKENSVTLNFSANNDRNTVIVHLLVIPFNARYVRFHPTTFHSHTSMRAEVYGCRNVHSCSMALGLEDKRIPDSSISASDSNDSNHRPSLARLNIRSDGKHVGAWCPKPKSTNQWLQVNLGEITAVTKVATQGRYNSNDRVTTYSLSYSIDGSHWTGYKQRGVEKVFAGNTDRNSVTTHTLKPHIEARYVRFHPKSHNYNIPCLRAELYGCGNVQICPMPMGVEDGRIPDEAFTASSAADRSGKFAPHRARLNLLPDSGGYCWAAKKNDKNQWLQVNLGGLFSVRGVAVQGRQDKDEWVKSFSVSHNDDSVNWVYIRENSQVKVFSGNSDRSTIVQILFSSAVYARRIRFHPKSWQSHIAMRVEVYVCDDARRCVAPLGMESGHLPDGSLTASTYLDANSIPQFSRLNKIPVKGKSGAWCSRSNDGNQWLQVNFGQDTTVRKVVTQGRYDGDYWVMSYSLSYSVDGTHWAYYRLSDGHIKIFGGNIDRNTPVSHLLHTPIKANYIRFNPKTWNGKVCMRAEVYGCHEGGRHCSKSLGLEDGRIQDGAMSASSIHSSSYAAKYARLNKGAEWSSKSNDGKQWLQIDLGRPTSVTKVATQGRHNYAQWVTSYYLSYSLTTSYWVSYKKHGIKKVFRGNFDINSIVIHKIFPPINARFVRIHPLTYHSHTSMRAELYGCPVEGI